MGFSTVIICIKGLDYVQTSPDVDVFFGIVHDLIRRPIIFITM